MNTSLPILTAAQTRLCDEHTIRELHIPSRTLMERAARAGARLQTDAATAGFLAGQCVIAVLVMALTAK